MLLLVFIMPAGLETAGADFNYIITGRLKGGFFTEDFFVGHKHAGAHVRAELFTQLFAVHHSADSVHAEDSALFLLRKIIKAVLFIETVVFPHKALHLPYEVTEYLEAADPEEPRGL